MGPAATGELLDRKSTRLNSSHLVISYAVFCLKKTVSQMETAEITDGPVAQPLALGYQPRARLLRPATLSVSKPPADNAKLKSQNFFFKRWGPPPILHFYLPILF